MSGALDPALEIGFHDLESALAHGKAAAESYRRAVSAEHCPICKQTWATLAQVGDMAVDASTFQSHINRHPALAELMVSVLVAAEPLHLWAFLGHIVGKVRGWRS